MRIGDSLDARWVCVLNKKGVAKKVVNSISVGSIWGRNYYILIAEDRTYLKISWEQFQFINWDNKEVTGRWK